MRNAPAVVRNPNVSPGIVGDALDDTRQQVPAPAMPFSDLDPAGIALAQIAGERAARAVRKLDEIGIAVAVDVGEKWRSVGQVGLKALRPNERVLRCGRLGDGFQVWRNPARTAGPRPIVV